MRSRVSLSPAAIGIVSDDVALRRSLSILLSLEGHQVLAGNTEDAPLLAAQVEARLEDNPGQRCCLLIDDRRSRGGTGLDLAEALARRGALLPVVLLADTLDAKARARAEAAHVAVLLEKPAVGEAIVLGVARALERPTPAMAANDSARPRAAAR